MGIPLRQQIRVGAYVMKQRLLGNKRYPLVLMLEPLFRCNLACAGCGKIDYPKPILDRRLSVEECLDAVDECGFQRLAELDEQVHQSLVVVDRVHASGARFNG